VSTGERGEWKSPAAMRCRRFASGPNRRPTEPSGNARNAFTVWTPRRARVSRKPASTRSRSSRTESAAGLSCSAVSKTRQSVPRAARTTAYVPKREKPTTTREMKFSRDRAVRTARPHVSSEG